MLTRLSVLALLAVSLSACVVSPRIQVAESLYFDAAPISQQPMSYNDILCCVDCTA